MQRILHYPDIADKAVTGHTLLITADLHGNDYGMLIVSVALYAMRYFVMSNER
jgi:hypothetical protein